MELQGNKIMIIEGSAKSTSEIEEIFENCIEQIKRSPFEILQTNVTVLEKEIKYLFVIFYY